MYCFFFLLLLASIVVSLVFFAETKKEIPPEQVPIAVQEIARRQVPGFRQSQCFQKGNRYYLVGSADNQPMEIRLKLSRRGHASEVYESEIHFELNAEKRRLLQKRRIEIDQVPDEIVLRCKELVSRYVGPFDYIERVKSAHTSEGTAYDLRGWSGRDRFELELLANGKALELEARFNVPLPVRLGRKIHKRIAACSIEDKNRIFHAVRYIASIEGMSGSESQKLKDVATELEIGETGTQGPFDEPNTGSLKLRKPKSMVGRELLIYFSVMVARSDGFLSPQEVQAIRRLGVAVGISDGFVRECLKTVALSKGESRKGEANRLERLLQSIDFADQKI